MVHVLVTGGLGFIGSHTVLSLLETGHSVAIVDDLSNAFPRVLDHLKRLAGNSAGKITFHKANVCDPLELDTIFAKEKPDAVIHFAGSKAVGESVDKPLHYYRNNMASSIVLLEVMQTHDCKQLVFSSSCTVYGQPKRVPLTEDSELVAINPYGRTKLFQEDMFRDVAAADPGLRIILLRYFNPIGAHPSGDLGEHPVGVPNNLLPFVQQVALGQRDFLRVYGGDYDTPDGTPVRDYIHVMDLAEGHVSALDKLLQTPDFGCQAVNLGTGRGTTVLDMIAAFEKASGVKVAYKIVDCRAGDAPAVWAATDLAEKMLGWRATRGLDDMCADTWRWAQNYPLGYDTPAAS